MSEYKVEVFTADYVNSGTINYIYIKLIGLNSSTDAQLLNNGSTFKTGQKCESIVKCPSRLGTLLLVELESKSKFLISDMWFCAKLVVTTPEGIQHHFPCYKWLESKEKLLLRDAVALLKHEETEEKHLSQRREDLEERCKAIRWRDYLSKIPKIIDASTPSELPAEIQFSWTKTASLEHYFLQAFTELNLEKWLHHHSDVWNNLEEVNQVLDHHCTKTSDYVKDHWDSDEFFGYQFLNGLNPMMIRRCSKLPSNFPVTDKMVNFSLKTEMKNGNIFLVDYQRLKGLGGNMIQERQQFMAAPLCLLLSTPEKTLIPIAIQLKQDPGKSNPIFLPTDSKWDWLLAKLFVRNAEFNEHELNYHLLRTHLLGEVFTIAMMRNLPSAHPLFKLLNPHTRYNIHINIMARNSLISSNGVFAMYTAIGYDGLSKLLQKAVSSLMYSSLCLPDDIAERGMGEIPNYYYRDYGMALWDIINKFVQRVIVHYYVNDGDVQKDSELQNWIKDIFENGFLGNVNTGIPQSLNTVGELVKFLTMVIFTVSAQHAAVNSGQFEYGGWMPNFPSSLRRPPPSRKGEATEKTFLDALPDIETTINIVMVLYTLSNKYSDHSPLGYYPEDLFDSSGPCDAFTDFRTDLDQLADKINKENLKRKLPYTYLSPTNVENSIGI